MKLVSVILPTYGGGQHLERAIESVLVQDYPLIELIIVDDNGKGTLNQIKTERITKKYLEKENVKYIVHNVNKNGSVARNTGYKYSSGDYISLLDDDDVYSPSKISSQVVILDELDDSWGMVYCSYQKIVDGKVFEKVTAKKQGYILYDILMHTPSATSGSLMIRKNVFDSLGGFDETFKRHQDWEFTARLAFSYKVAVSKSLGLTKYITYRNSPTSIELAKKYRYHYIEKMMPIITTLSKRQQKNVLISNNMSIFYRYLKSGNYKDFFFEYRQLNAGLYGFYIIIKTLISYFLLKIFKVYKTF
jgi:glycosyltransferase involved in cell wall biosynthesis